MFAFLLIEIVEYVAESILTNYYQLLIKIDK